MSKLPQKTAPSSATQPDAAPESKVGIVIASVATLLLLAALDQTIVSTALPTIVSDLGGLNHLSWVVTAYILCATIVAPLYGKFGDIYGRRNVVFISVGLFLSGSALCGAAQSMTMLIGARALQGLGGGGLFVLALSIIGDIVEPKDRGKIQGVFAAVFGTSSVIGPLIGGWFVDTLSWHWIFYVNLPIGTLALVGFTYGFKTRGTRISHKVDYAGAIALSLTLGSIVLASSLGGREFGWGDWRMQALLALVVTSLVSFIYIETKASDPILPLGLFKKNVFWVTSALNFVAGVVMFGSLVFLPTFFQLAKGNSPTESGLQMVPMTVGILLASTFSGIYMGKTQRYKILPIIGLSIAALGLGMLTQVSPDFPAPLLWLAIFMLGLGMGTIFPVVTTAVQMAVPRELLGTATASGLMFREIGAAISIALSGAIFTTGITNKLQGVEIEGLANVGELGPQILSTLPSEIKNIIAQSVSSAMQPIYVVTASMAVCGVIIAFALREISLTDRPE